jgi:DNA-binding transcriptional ArsR family regulator
VRGLTGSVNPRGIAEPVWEAQRVSLSIDISGLPAGGFRFAPSPLGELAAMLHVLCEPVHHPELRGWHAETVSLLPPDLTARIVASDLLWRSSRADFLLPGQPRPTLVEELDAVDQLADETYVAAALVTTTCGSVPLSRARNPLRSSQSRAAVVHRARARGPGQAAFAERLIVEPGTVRGQVRTLLLECADTFFDDAWTRIGGRLAAASRHAQDVFTRQGLAHAVRLASPAITLDPSGGRILIDKLQDDTTDAAAEGGLTLSPTAFGWPHLLVVHAPGWPPVIQYPISTPATSTGPDDPTLEVMQQRLRALDHPLRMRLVRTLARGAHTTTQLAQAWNLTAPVVSRHLAVLRAAGLVTARRRGRYVAYDLDLSATERLGADLVTALLR